MYYGRLSQVRLQLEQRLVFVHDRHFERPHPTHIILLQASVQKPGNFNLLQ